MPHRRLAVVRTCGLVVPAAAAGLLLAAGQAGAQSITSLGVLPGGTDSQALAVSADGSTVVGYSTVGTDTRAFRWRAGVMQDLGTLPGRTSAIAWGVSPDGALVVGSSANADFIDHAFAWSQASGMRAVGALAEGAASTANGISADGAVIVGQSGSAFGNRAFRAVPTPPNPFPPTTDPFTLTSLGALSPQDPSGANAVTPDGSVIVGLSGSNAAGRAFRYTILGGMQSLGTLPGGTSSWAFGVSADGNVAVGFSRQNGRERAARWVGQNPPQDLGALISTFPPSLSIAYSASGDGSVIVGRATQGFNSRGFLWTAQTGMVDLNVYLPSIGIDLSEWTIFDAQSISADGRVIVGGGLRNGLFEAYRVVLSTPNPACNLADVTGIGGPPATPDGLLTGDDFNAFIAAFAAGEGGGLADVTGIGGPPALPDGLITGDDFNAFIGAFAQGCP